MNSKRQIRVKKLQGTPYMISQDELLGKGSYGAVYKAYNRQNPSQLLVAKIIPLQTSQTQIPSSIESQIEVIRQLPRHQNLVNCVRSHIQSLNNLYIIMEYCNGGSLQSYIQKMVLVSQQKIWDFITQVSKGYRVLLDANIIHRDLKPENILIHNGTYKLADFGMSKRLRDTEIIQNISYKGTPLYIAPEIIEKQVGSSKIDIFSLGCIIYQLMYDGNHPFYDEKKKYSSYEQYYSSIKEVEVQFKQKNKKGEFRSIQLRKLVKHMIEYNYQNRISWLELFQHERINIDKFINKDKETSSLNKSVTDKQKQLQFLRRSLIEVNISSAKIEQFTQKVDIRGQSSNMTQQLIEFQQIINQKQLKTISSVIFRFKITYLTIIYCNSKINNLIIQNSHHKILHHHVVDAIKDIGKQGIYFLLKNIQIINHRLGGYEKMVIRNLVDILQDDRNKLMDQYLRLMRIYKEKEVENVGGFIEKYDLREYETKLYNFLTQYYEYPKELKEKVTIIVSLLVDIYDSSLKLTQITQEQTISWIKQSNIEQIQTKMDQLCFNKLQPSQFHSFLMSKQHINQSEVTTSLKRIGLIIQ